VITAALELAAQVAGDQLARDHWKRANGTWLSPPGTGIVSGGPSYDNLGAHRRHEAVEQACALGLLAPPPRRP
jgi:hypothetical protein